MCCSTYGVSQKTKNFDIISLIVNLEPLNLNGFSFDQIFGSREKLSKVYKANICYNEKINPTKNVLELLNLKAINNWINLLKLY